RLGERFEVTASLTVAEAYALRPFVRERPGTGRHRLVTTGLIDPEVCLWGHRRCRYLGVDFNHPAVIAAAGMPRGLRRRLTRSRRPKVLVAGLSKRVECFLDVDGRCFGTVSTFT